MGDKRGNNMIVDIKRGMVGIISVSRELECEDREIEEGIKENGGAEDPCVCLCACV